MPHYLLAVPQLVIGAWALAAPERWFETFPGFGPALVAGEQVGYPVMLKSTAGGGGIGLTRCNDEAALVDAYETVKRLGQNFFSDSGVFIEKYIQRPRHIDARHHDRHAVGIVVRQAIERRHVAPAQKLLAGQYLVRAFEQRAQQLDRKSVV